MHSFFMVFGFEIVAAIFGLGFIMGIDRNVVQRIINVSENFYFFSSMLPAHLVQGLVFASLFHLIRVMLYNYYSYYII